MSEHHKSSTLCLVYVFILPLGNISWNEINWYLSYNKLLLSIWLWHLIWISLSLSDTFRPCIASLSHLKWEDLWHNSANVVNNVVTEDRNKRRRQQVSASNGFQSRWMMMEVRSDNKYWAPLPPSCLYQPQTTNSTRIYLHYSFYPDWSTSIPNMMVGGTKSDQLASQALRSALKKLATTLIGNQLTMMNLLRRK